MQAGIVVGENSITGTLNSVSGYTDFSSNPEEQSGHYLALAFEVEPEDAVTTVEIVGGTKGPVTLDEDMLWVGLIKDKDSQTIRVTATSGDKTVTKNYDLTGLTLA